MERVIFRLLHLTLSNGEGWVPWLAVPPPCSGWGAAPSSHSWLISWQPLHNPWNYCQASLLCEHPQSTHVLSLKQTSKMRCFQSSKESSMAPRGEAFPGFPLPQLSLASLFPSFPFPPLHCWLFASLKCSCPCSLRAFNLTQSAGDRSNVSSFRTRFPQGRAAGRAAGCIGRCLCPGALQKDTLRLLLASAPLLHWGQKDVVFGEARLAALLALQNKCLSWNRSEELTCFLNKANSYPFYHKSPKSWVSPCPGNSGSAEVGKGEIYTDFFFNKINEKEPISSFTDRE